MFKVLRKVFDKFKGEDESPEEALQAVGDEGLWKLKGSYIDDVLWDLEVALYEADVAQEIVQEIKEKVKSELSGKRVKRGHDRAKAVEGALKKAIRDILQTDRFDVVERIKGSPKPYVIMFVGVNGTGKTTTIAKMAHLLRKEGISTVLAAGDTFRAGAIEQISIHADKLGTKVVKHVAGADPAAVAFDAVEHARARYKDVVLIDTAGRMQTNANLMDQLAKIQKVAKPHLNIFVGDSLAGNDAVEQAKRFQEKVGIDAVILTKIDADSKGGAALSIAHAANAPIIYVGVGQEYDDLEPFSVDWMLKRLFSTD